MRAKDRFLCVRIRCAAVEPALADGDGAPIAARARDPLREVTRQLVGDELGNDLRVDAEGAPHSARVVPRSERDERVPRPRADRRNEHPDHAGCGRPGDDLLAVVVERFQVEVAMGVDHAIRS